MGQIEAARSIGMTSSQTMRYIILPQAIKNSFPSIGNEFIVNIEDSSMLNVIGVIEVFFQSRSVAGKHDVIFRNIFYYLFHLFSVDNDYGANFAIY